MQRLQNFLAAEFPVTPALMIVTWDTGAAYTNQPSLSWQTWRTPEKLYKWYGDRVERGESRKRTEPERPEK